MNSEINFNIFQTKPLFSEDLILFIHNYTPSKQKKPVSSKNKNPMNSPLKRI